MEKEEKSSEKSKKRKMGQEGDFFERESLGETERWSGEEVGSCRERRKYLTLFSFPFGPLGFSESSLSPE